MIVFIPKNRIKSSELLSYDSILHQEYMKKGVGDETDAVALPNYIIQTCFNLITDS